MQSTYTWKKTKHKREERKETSWKNCVLFPLGWTPFFLENQNLNLKNTLSETWFHFQMYVFSKLYYSIYTMAHSKDIVGSALSGESVELHAFSNICLHQKWFNEKYFFLFVMKSTDIAFGHIYRYFFLTWKFENTLFYSMFWFLAAMFRRDFLSVFYVKKVLFQFEAFHRVILEDFGGVFVRNSFVRNFDFGFLGQKVTKKFKMHR